MRHSRGARQTVSEALKAVYVQAYLTALPLGFSAGQAAGRVEGVITGCVVTSCASGFIAFVFYLFLRASRP